VSTTSGIPAVNASTTAGKKFAAAAPPGFDLDRRAHAGAQVGGLIIRIEHDAHRHARLSREREHDGGRA
jgi:hypothetical protein